MTETASDVILDALKELVAIPSEAAIGAYEAQAGIFYLNAMMQDFAINGINVGYTIIDNLADAMTVPDSALEPMVKNLAIEMSPAFKGSLTSPDLFEQAQDGLNTLLQISLPTIANAAYPSTLAMGSGNYGGTWGDTFYSGLPNQILTENNGYIAPEDADAS
jgi:hypothetical protein